MALHEMPIMAPVAFILEFFVVEKLATKLAFTFVRPTDRPQFITYAISLMIVCIMCPVMSLIATLLFKEPIFSLYFDLFDGLIQTYVFVFLTSLFMKETMGDEE